MEKPAYILTKWVLLFHWNILGTGLIPQCLLVLCFAVFLFLLTHWPVFLCLSCLVCDNTILLGLNEWLRKCQAQALLHGRKSQKDLLLSQAQCAPAKSWTVTPRATNLVTLWGIWPLYLNQHDLATMHWGSVPLSLFLRVTMHKHTASYTSLCFCLLVGCLKEVIHMY